MARTETRRRRHIVRTDPRFLYSYSPGDGATRYVFQHGEHTSDHTALGLKDAVLFVMENPPTDRDYERTTDGSAKARGEG